MLLIYIIMSISRFATLYWTNNSQFVIITHILVQFIYNNKSFVIAY